MGEHLGDGRTATNLYSLAPGQFTAARDRAVRAARAAGHRDQAARLAALRRPTQPAWAVNQLTRHHPGQLAQLLDVGAAMRTAQAQPDPGALRELVGRRRRLMEELVHTAVQDAADAGERLGDAAVQAVEQTLAAALADPSAADQVAEGRLAAALSVPTALPDLGRPLAAVPDPPDAAPAAGGGTRPSGWQSAQATGKPVTAAPRTRASRSEAAAEQRAQAVAELEQRRRQLEGEAEAAERAAVRAEEDLAGAEERARDTQGEVERAHQVLDRARFAARRAEETRERAADRARGLREQAGRARAAADRVRGEAASRPGR
ncbi:hypothetical protein ACFW1A_00980 [Kitasatospora sp. NPDC058965]|uniref:hypothetical protein n=1 Tax=Kitasatospora sp. NPDC058965 TaxID=3346682 RepID=UPI0036885FDB